MLFVFQVLFTVVGFMIGLFCIPFGCYWTWKLWQYRHHTALIKRRLNVSWYLIVCSFFFVITEVWWFIMLADLIPFIVRNETTELIDWIFWVIGLNGTFWFSVWKFWLLYFDMRWMIAARRAQWYGILNRQSLVVDQNKSSKTNSDHEHGLGLHFYIKYKRTLGGFKFTYPVAVFLTCFWSALQLSSAYFVIFASDDVSGFAYTVQYLISFGSYVFSFIFLCIIFYQLVNKLRFDDSFYVSLELKYLFVLLATYNFLKTVNTVLNLTLSPGVAAYNNKHEVMQVWYFIFSVIRTMVFYFIWLLHTRWIFYKLNTVLNDTKNFGFGLRAGSFDATTSHELVPVEDEDGKPLTQLAVTPIDNIDRVMSSLVSHDVDAQQTKQQKLVEKRMSTHQQQPELQEQLNDKKNENLNKRQQITLNKVISHKKGIDLFMTHLGKEFSTECLLSVCEFVQYQNFIYKQLTKMTQDMDNKTKILDEMRQNLPSTKVNFILPRTVPLSDSFTGILALKREDGGRSRKGSLASVASATFETPQMSPVPTASPVGSPVGRINEDAVNIEDPAAPQSPQSTQSGQSAKADVDAFRYESLDDLIDDCKLISYKIFQKYITNGANYEINIMWNTRGDLMSLISSESEWMQNDNVDILKLFYLFDDCFNQMVSLLVGCLTRFKDTPEFQKFEMTFYK